MRIDEEFQKLIPALTDEELKGLEASILAEGCRDALVVWGDVLVDGHNRYKICMQHDVPFTTVQKEFANRDEALLWILNNQLSRRNLNDFQRIEMVNKYEDAVKARAEERRLATLKQNQPVNTDSEKLPEAENKETDVEKLPHREDAVQIGMKSRDELGAMAGVSGSTYEHATAVLENAPEPVVEAARNKELSINAAYEVTKMPEEKQAEVAERIENGEKPKDVVSDVRAKAGVANKTYNKAVKVIEEAAPEVVEAVRRGDMSINQAYNQVKAEAKKQEIEKAKADIADQESNDFEAILRVGDGISYTPDEPYDLLLTDPPYSTDVDDIDSFVSSWLYRTLENVKPTGFAYVFIGAYPNELKAYLNVELPKHIELKQVLIWTYKNTLGNNPKDRYKQNYQACLFYRGTDAPNLDCPLTNEQWAVQEINAPDGRIGDRYHAWQKPMEIAERFIRHSTKHGDMVFDPFACTGTFLLAASKLGRRSYGFEINSENADIARKRGVRIIE